MKRPLAALGVALGLAAGGIAAPVRASEPSDAEVQQRLRIIEQRLDRGTAGADRWWYTWSSIYGGLTAGQGAIALGTSDAGLRIDMAVGAIGTALGSVALALFPLEARFAGARLRALPEGTVAQRRGKLGSAETLLRSCAQDEEFGRSWVSHLLGNGVALVSGIVLAAGFHRPVSGIANFASGLALTELHILTQPTRAIDDWNDYAQHGSPSTGRAATNQATWLIVPKWGGIGVAGSF